MMAGALVLLASGAGLADGGGHGYHDGDPMYFDPDSIVTLEGNLTGSTGSWEPRGHGNHTGGGMSFEFEADNGEVFELMLSPVWFLEENGIALSPGERITVTGSVVDEYDNGDHHGSDGGHGNGHGDGHGGNGMMDDHEHPYLVATALRVDGETTLLRDEEGYPLWRGGPGWMGHTWYDPSSEASLTGSLSEILGLWSVWGHGNHTGNGMHYVFDSSSGESFYAMVGPWWFMRAQGVSLYDGRDVEIVGSIVAPYWARYGDKRFVIAREVRVGSKTVQLRDDWGYPLWHGTGWHYSSPNWAAGEMLTMTGEVVKVRRRSHGRFLDKGFEAVVLHEGEHYTLFIAPNWDVNHLGMDLGKGDLISARGPLVRESGKYRMAIQYLDVGGRRWRFRKSSGSPLWVRGAK